MKFLLVPYNWQHSTIAGGEVYLMRLAKYLIDQSHEIKAIVGSEGNYIDDMGIECRAQGHGIDQYRLHSDWCQWCDVIVTHLLGNALGYNLSNQHKKPLIFIAHNNSKNYAPIHGFVDMVHVIYNTYTLRDSLQKAFGQFNGFVLHPLQSNFSGRGNKITLINCNHNKGGHIFAEIARRLPDYEFLGVFGGYGDQIEAHLPNITYLPNKTDMAAVYASTKVLLMPSEFESYGQVGAEAMQCGIPVIAHPCPGVKENLGDAGLFIDRSDIDRWVNCIINLMSDNLFYWRQSQLSFERANAIAEKSKEELVRFNTWLEKIPLAVSV